MGKCKVCAIGPAIRKVLPEYGGDLIGAPFRVIVENAAFEERCAHCGFLLGIGIPNLHGLVAATAMTRAMCPQKLNGQEIRYLRAATGWKAVQLAEKLGVDPATLSRWEADAQPISESYEKYLRLFVCVSLMRSAPLADFDPHKLINLKIDPARPATLHIEAQVLAGRQES